MARWAATCSDLSRSVVRHPEGLEDVPAEVAVERLTADVLDDLTQGGEAVIAVGKGGAGLRHQPDTAAVVLGQRRQRLPYLHAVKRWTAIERPPRRMEQIAQVEHVGNPGGVGQQMPQRRRTPSRLGRDEFVGAQVVVGGGIEIDQSLAPIAASPQSR